MTSATSPQAVDTPDAMLTLAIAHHQAGRLHEAEGLYRAILQIQPHHPDANHNLGVLAVQLNQHQVGLNHFKVALESNPIHAQFWLSYTDALIQTGAFELAHQALAGARQRGVQEDVLASLVARLGPAPQEMNTLVALFAEGRYAEARPLAEAMTVNFPQHVFGWKALGALFSQLGRNEEALAPLQKAAALSPEDADVHNNLGYILQDLGRSEEAALSCRRAVALQPDFAMALNNMGNALQSLGQLDAAAASYRRALENDPDSAMAYSNFGAALRSLGRFEEAVAICRRALEIQPDFAMAHNNLGNSLKELGQLEEAVDSYRRAVEISPDYAEVHSNLGAALQDVGLFEEAEVSYRRAVEIKPDYIEAHSNLAHTLQSIGRLDEAMESCRRALEINPDFTDAHSNLGNILKNLSRPEEAEASYRRALATRPDSAMAHSNLGAALYDMGRFAEAEASYRRAIELEPDFAMAHNNLGNALKDLGRQEEAAASYKRVLEIKPDYADVYSNLLFFYGYHGSLSKSDYLGQARCWELDCVPVENCLAARGRHFKRQQLAGRRLRVGYVSGDFRQHAVSYFVEQLFAQHDRTRVEIFAYSANVARDAVTDRLESLSDHWTLIAGLPEDRVLARIESDEIDVLIDLAGHSAHNSLKVFASRAAPVQAHYLGYFASTGLTEMDYWIGDEVLTPAKTDSDFSEKVWRLPRVWVSYDGKQDAPLPDWDADRDGTVWLGSFNNLGKLTEATLHLWAQVLHALPEGKLLLKTKELKNPANRQRIFDALGIHGISPDRIELRDGSETLGWAAHMAYYNRLDIALDPVGGVGGGTTTCDALWMGVPVITQEGDRMATRMTASMLNAIDHAEWVVHSEVEYVDKVVALARDVKLRRALRTEQRRRMAGSALFDTQGLVSSLENAYTGMFVRWCAQRR